MDLTQYFDKYQSKIRQASEQLFVQEFLYPLLGSKLEAIEPQYPFIDSTGKHRYIDFAYQGSTNRLAFEVNGESYHAEGIISDETFDDNLFRQNEILRSGYRLLRFSYNQLQSPQWRSIVQETLKDFLGTHAPELVSEYSLEPVLKVILGKVICTETEFFLQNSVSSAIQKGLHYSNTYYHYIQQTVSDQ